MATNEGTGVVKLMSMVTNMGVVQQRNTRGNKATTETLDLKLKILTQTPKTQTVFT